MIIARALTKRLAPSRRSTAVDLDVREGDRYGLLGPNGSGKTTLVRMLLGLVYATSGRIEVLGRRMPRLAREVLPQIGALVEARPRYPHLSGRTNLALFDAAGPRRGRRRTPPAPVDEALERVGLAGIDRRPVQGLLAGHAAAPRPRGGADAPTAAAYPRRADERAGSRAASGDVRDLLGRAERGGVTVFVSSHLLAEVEQLCTRVGVLDDGRLVLQEDLAALRAPTGRIVLDTPDADQVAGAARRPGRAPRWAAAAGPLRRRGRAQRAAGRRGAAGQLDRPAAAHAGGGRALGDRHRLGSHRGHHMIKVELVKLLRRPRDLGIERPADLRAAVRGGGVHHGHPPGRRRLARAARSCPPCCRTARSTRRPRWRSCCRCSCRRGGGRGRGLDRGRGRRGSASATCWCARSAGPGCWSPSSSRSSCTCC